MELRGGELFLCSGHCLTVSFKAMAGFVEALGVALAAVLFTVFISLPSQHSVRHRLPTMLAF